VVHRILKQVLRESGEDVESGKLWVSNSAEPAVSSSRPQGTAAAHHGNSPTGEAKEYRSDGHRARDGRDSASEEVIPLEELHDIGEECSRSERRAADAERELMEWKKVKFMADRLGEDFAGLIVSVTKFGFFVELTDMFVEGLVPLSSLTDDHYVYHDSTRQIIGQRSRKTFSVGGQVRVLVDRIDPVLKKIQFAPVPEAPSQRKKRRK
jgi:ribonuclease R